MQMGEVAEILKTAYEVFRANEDVPINVDSQNLGMAYAIPKGTEGTVVDSYGPWTDREIRQVFYRQSSIVGSVLAEIQLIMSWRVSSANQYIIEANLDKKVISLDPTVSVSINVHFNQPNPIANPLEAYEIPFNVSVDFRPVGPNETAILKGVIRADGTASFDPA
jgi:hypothetical protein